MLMLTPNSCKSYLTEEQINRIYEVYDFEDNEEIESAWYEDGQLYIDYDSPDGGNVYIPSMDDDTDKEKIDYILTGHKFNG